MIIVDFLYCRSFHYSLSPNFCLFSILNLIFIAVVFITIIIIILLLVSRSLSLSLSLSLSHSLYHNSDLCIEYNNWVPWIDPTASINTSSKRKYRRRYIDDFKLPLIKNLHYMREENKLNRVKFIVIFPKRYDNIIYIHI